MNNSVGFQKIEIEDKQKGITFPTLVLYPTHKPAQAVTFGPFTLEVARGADPVGEQLPLVVISHGSGGSPMAYRTLAHHLALNGFVVCLPEHPFNHRLDNSGEGTLENMRDRPRHISLVVDEMYEKFKHFLKPNAVAIIGHSMGGHTALALAGGIPHTRHMIEFCQQPENKQLPPCVNMKESRLVSHEVEIQADNRVQVIVLFDPASFDFQSTDALSKVQVPVLLLSAGTDPTAIAQAKIIQKGLSEPEKLNARIVENASHYSFLSPFPIALRSRVGPAGRDPEGFDREAFHEELNREVASFLSGTLN